LTVRKIATLLLAGAAVLPLPAQAQDLGALRAQLDAMQAEIARLSAQVVELEAGSAARGLAATAVVAAPPSPGAAPAPAQTVAWKGAPENTGPNGFSFKPRGRLQLDAATVLAPSTVAAGHSLGFSTEVRRAFLGAEG
jgi:phosphate-selective porin OprO/OprP